MNASSSRGVVTRIVLLILGVAAGPAAWVLQLVLGYGLASYACYPSDAPARVSPPPGWHGEAGVLLGLNLACLALALAGAALSLTLWRDSGRGPAEGRARFLAMCGMFSCLGFATAILFDTVPILAVPACWSIPT
ncbi:MAG: hypothetical protein ACREEB_19190 [Caulobacteraceae bacterium]